jgi:DnaJ-class molecular chaperone
MSADTLEKPKSYYELLEVPHDASDAEIKRAYRRLALRYHPDRWKSQERRMAELRFRLINEAYAHLKTSEKRARYNNTLLAENDNDRRNRFWSQIADILGISKLRA